MRLLALALAVDDPMETVENEMTKRSEATHHRVRQLLYFHPANKAPVNTVHLRDKYILLPRR